MASIKVFHTDKIDHASILQMEAEANDYVVALAAEQSPALAQMDTAMSDNGFTITIMSGLSETLLSPIL